jgi:hypothetical protein
MFGKKKSASDQFIMARGREVGNLRSAKPAPAKKPAAPAKKPMHK